MANRCNCFSAAAASRLVDLIRPSSVFPSARSGRGGRGGREGGGGGREGEGGMKENRISDSKAKMVVSKLVEIMIKKSDRGTFVSWWKSLTKTRVKTGAKKITGC
jgi:hypothetical protein